jgi:sensor histidine kinase YesM
MVMATAGPALATAARYLRLPLRRERGAVVLAMLLGMAASFVADMHASTFVERQVETALPPHLRASAVHTSPAPHGAPSPQEVRARIQRASPAGRAGALALNLLGLAVVYGLFGGGLSLRAYFTEQRRREHSARRRELEHAVQERRAAEMRLGVLQAQVEPHFLFNTLAAVRALLRERPTQAEETLDALVAYLRASIPRMREQGDALESTLGDQLDLCAHYLDVMRLRSGGRITYSVDVDPALRAESFPPLLLITLVENAVKHGLEPKRGPGHVAMHAGCGGGRLRVDVADDGAGLRPSAHGGGLGLENVRAQLRARYGAGATLSLQGRAAGGTLASIEVPVGCP